MHLLFFKKSAITFWATQYYILLPAEEFTFRMLCGKTCFLAEEGNGECVSSDHHEHGDIKCHQRSKNEEGAVVYYTDVVLRHNVLLVDQT